MLYLAFRFALIHLYLPIQLGDTLLQIEYSPGGRVVHGNPNLGVANTLTLNPGEHVTRIQGLSDTRIVAIQFTTNHGLSLLAILARSHSRPLSGRTSPRWGGSGGQIFDWYV
jgi:hypothetical protein